MNFFCFLFNTPTFKRLHDLPPNAENRWRVGTLSANIKAVPYSENVFDLIKIKKLVRFYDFPVAYGDYELNVKRKLLSKLHKLDSLADERIAEIYLTAKNIPIPPCIEDVKKLHVMYRQKVDTLTKLIDLQFEVHYRLNSCKRLTLTLYESAQDLHEYLGYDSLVFNTKPDAIKPGALKLWDFNEIKIMSEKIGYNPSVTLSEQIQSIEHQLTMFEEHLHTNGEELRSLKQKLHVMIINKEFMKQMKHLGKKKSDEVKIAMLSFY